MGAYASKDDLYGIAITGEDLELAGGLVVRVRGLNRLEAAGANKGDPGEIEMRIVALGMVDPSMTLAEVRKFYKGAPAGVPEQIARKIEQLTNGTRPAKEWSKSVPDPQQPGEL